MRHVTWTPETNSQRTALARFGTDWQLTFPHPITVLKRLRWCIHPVGRVEEARWVPMEQVNLITD